MFVFSDCRCKLNTSCVTWSVRQFSTVAAQNPRWWSAGCAPFTHCLVGRLLVHSLCPSQPTLMLPALYRCVIGPFCSTSGCSQFGNSNCWFLRVCKGSHDAYSTLTSPHCFTLKVLELNSVMSSPVCHTWYTWCCSEPVRVLQSPQPGNLNSVHCCFVSTQLLLGRDVYHIR